MSTAVNSLNAGMVVMPTFDSQNLEILMLAVQARRSNLLEAQLRAQVQTVQAINNKVSLLNQIQSSYQQALDCYSASDSATVALSDSNRDRINTSITEAAGAYQKAASKTLDGAAVPIDDAAIADQWSLRKGISKGEIQTKLTELKGQIDSLSSTQQMDMVRLQGLSNRRNEAFDLMTGFVKKESDNRSTIVRNIS